jgi:L-methionine (R)-S-oxide reductase
LKRDEALDRIKLMVGDRGPEAVKDVVVFLAMSFPLYSWVGVYVARGGVLVLGPWWGPAATEHTRIPIGTGVCGAAAKSGKTEIVGDVRRDPRYLSCFRSTRSEIVVPIHRDGKVVGEIDVDSDMLDAFTVDDQRFLEKVAVLLAPLV